MARPRLSLLGALRRELPQGEKLLLAVSGGRDSMSLLAGCVEVAAKLNLNLGVAHLDHGLRSSSSDDCNLVKDTAKQMGLPCYNKRLERSPPAGANLEEWCRKERYRYLSNVREEHEYSWILTAHTAGDLAETFLMRLVSNKELKGIAARDPHRRLLRPLLRVSREEVNSFLEARRLVWREDESNQDTYFLRNRIRHLVLPLLKKNFDARIEETLSERALGVMEDISFIYGLLEAPLSSVAEYERGSQEWLRAVRKALADMPRALAWRFAELLIKPELGFNVGRKHAVAVAELLRGNRLGVELPGGLSLRKRGGGISFEPAFTHHVSRRQ